MCIAISLPVRVLPPVHRYISLMNNFLAAELNLSWHDSGNSIEHAQLDIPLSGVTSYCLTF